MYNNTLGDMKATLNTDLKKIRMPEVYKNIISYMYDILSLDGGGFGYSLCEFQAKQKHKHIDVFFVLKTFDDEKQFAVSIYPETFEKYSILLLNHKTQQMWRLSNIYTSNYINSIGLLLHPERLLNAKNVQYT